MSHVGAQSLVLKEMPWPASHLISLLGAARVAAIQDSLAGACERGPSKLVARQRQRYWARLFLRTLVPVGTSARVDFMYGVYGKLHVAVRVIRVHVVQRVWQSHVVRQPYPP